MTESDFARGVRDAELVRFDSDLARETFDSDLARETFDSDTARDALDSRGVVTDGRLPRPRGL